MTLSARLATGCAAALIFGIVLWRFWPSLQYDALPTQMELGGERFTLETVLTEEAREKGLGGRESLCRTCAMLFVFEKPGRYAFWMKDMRFPIDIVWLFQNRAVFVAREVSPDFSGILDSAVVADQIIELSAGAAKNVDVGEKVRFSY
ncbi:MAG: hypothetical protein A3J06_03425 [Candidatus Moranbacteria bacterium RIFCSPLOWO2_02_FULL_48_19]|nr:MAG: hypothetical protein A3J06_03425 [Candidatus Moranbacteria bacterium RIFCSPLOWO2_02_FULL_48_19]OGI30416.1 MAG: hypothetical protein A3G09_01220 [Candidatus Moranbacteria bacterium RIFCSPLOWO2_12_FULL_48_12]